MRLLGVANEARRDLAQDFHDGLRALSPDALAALRDGLAADNISTRVRVALLTGATDTEAAEAANVTRETVNRWRHRDANFVAALSEARTNLSQYFHDGPLIFWRNRHAATSSLSTQFRYNPKPRCKPSVR